MNYTPYGTNTIMDKLVDSPIIDERISAAQKGYGLDVLVNDPVRDIRIYVVGHCNADFNILNKLVNDNDIQVRKAVALGCNGNPDILTQLLNDPHEHIRITALNQIEKDNPNLLNRLVCDPDANSLDVISEAVNNAKKGYMVGYDDDGYGLVQIFRDDTMFIFECDEDAAVQAQKDGIPIIPIEELPELGSYKSPVYIDCPKNRMLLEAISMDISIKVEKALNSDCPKEDLLKLSNDRNWLVRDSVAQNANCPAEVLERLAQDQCDLGYYYARAEVAHNSSCPLELLIQLSNDDGIEVRQNVALNPNCPVSAYFALINDPDVEVRQAALQVAEKYHLILSEPLENDKTEKPKKTVLERD